jgi:hypothetical protein
MRSFNVLALGAALVAVAACKDDNGVTDPAAIQPAALVRFVNATVDTGVVDFRFVDKVENLPNFLGVRFRGTSGLYTRVAPGTRPVRVFPNSTLPAEAQKRLIDTTITLEANERYTLVYGGQARGNADRLVVLHETATLPTPAAGMISLRVLNTDLLLGAADVYAARSDTADANVMTKFSAKFANVPLYGFSAYTAVPVAAAPPATGTRPVDSLYKFAAAPTGAATASYQVMPNSPGAAAPAGQTYGPQPGFQVAGSVLTVLITGTPTAGSPAAVAANQASSSRLVILPDKALNP